MSKYKIIILSLFAVFAFSAFLVSSATAAQWLHSGEEIKKEENGLIDGFFILEHTGGLGGNASARCTGQIHGTFGPGTKDEITDILGLAGELDTGLKCTWTSGPCSGVATVEALHLNWLSELLVIGGTIWDAINKSGVSEPGFGVTCAIKIGCEGLVRAKFVENGVNGAILEFRGVESLETKCADGGKGTMKGKGEVLGFFIG